VLHPAAGRLGRGSERAKTAGETSRVRSRISSMKTTTTMTSTMTGQVRLVRTIRPTTADGGFFTGWGPRVPGI
jgi:hypothetical protein